MKKILLAISGTVLLMTSLAFAEVETTVIDQRETNRQEPIDQGVASGQSNGREANRQNKQQEQANKIESRAKPDGMMTDKERARVFAAQDRAARHIAREKHVRQGKRRR